jgi:hypothetical protein
MRDSVGFLMRDSVGLSSSLIADAIFYRVKGLGRVLCVG